MIASICDPAGLTAAIHLRRMGRAECAWWTLERAERSALRVLFNVAGYPEG